MFDYVKKDFNHHVVLGQLDGRGNGSLVILIVDPYETKYFAIKLLKNIIIVTEPQKLDQKWICSKSWEIARLYFQNYTLQMKDNTSYIWYLILLYLEVQN